jgi:hypothetical protein
MHRLRVITVPVMAVVAPDTEAGAGTAVAVAVGTTVAAPVIAHRPKVHDRAAATVRVQGPAGTATLVVEVPALGVLPAVAATSARTVISVEADMAAQAAGTDRPNEYGALRSAVFLRIST